MGEREAWDRQPGETDKAFAAFCIYREGGSNRSVASAYAEYVRQRDGREPADGFSVPGYFQAWSASNGWVDRVRAWDTHVDRLARRQAEQEYTERLQDYRERQLKWSVKTSQGAARLMDLMLKRLETLKPGEIDPEDLNKHIRAIVELMESSAKSEREALVFERVVNALHEQGAF